MKIKELLGKVALDANANDIGKISDIEFNIETGKLEKLTISLKKSLLSTNDNNIEIDFDDIDSIGDYVLLSSTVELTNDDS
ncbi:MAG: PRC-barrel domain-containing protein [Methanobacteriaceae archaeon]|nr:PRC-barrel domain-containing protein [Methanobacteriaceae archaeon]